MGLKLAERKHLFKLLFWSSCAFLFLAGIFSPAPKIQAAPLSGMNCSTIATVPSSIPAHATGEKPQSKVWEHGGKWWAVFPTTGSGASSAGTWVWELQETATPSWSPILKLTNDTGNQADVKVVGSVVHVLLYDSEDSNLYSIEYTGLTYQLWSTRTTATNLALSDSETATIDIDSTGRMWLVSDIGVEIHAFYSDSPYSSWSSPIVVSVADTLDDHDDIGVVTALPGDRIGVFWSNQETDQFLFRIHNDADLPTVWQTVEVAASGGSITDDHVNVAVASDGTLYAAVKTGNGNAMALLVRRPAGTWDSSYSIGNGTRAIVQLNEVDNIVTVIYPTSTGPGGDIVYRESPADVINFGSEQTLQSGQLNDPSSTKENYTNELVVIFYDRDSVGPNGEIHGEFCKAPGPNVDVGITKTDAVDPVTIGDNITYTLDVVNNGPDSAENVTVTDVLPTGASFVSAVPSNATTCGHNSGTIICNVGTITNTGTVSITVNVTTTLAGVLTNQASVTSDGIDSNSANDSTSEDTTVNNTPPTNADLGVTKTDVVDPIDLGDNITYNVVVTNHGPEAANSIVVTDTLPANVTFVSATPSNGGTCSHNSGTITCSLGELLNLEAVTIPIVVTPTVPGTFTNNVTVAGNVIDGNNVNDNDSEATTVISTVVNMTLNPIHDAFVRDGNNTNYGTAEVLRLRGQSSIRNTYLKFEIPSEVTSVESAILRLNVEDEGGGTHSVYLVSNDYGDGSAPWIETVINGNNAPSITGSPLDTVAAQAVGTWEEFDVASAITNGTVSFAITSSSTSSHYYHSDETSAAGTPRPELVIVANVAPPEEPDIAVAPTSISRGQEPGVQVVETMTISNNGNADLNWTLTEDELTSCSATDDIPWASVNSAAGTINPSNNAAVDVTLDSTGLPDGTHTGDLCIQSDDPDTPLVQVSLTLDVCTAPSAVNITGIDVVGNTNTVNWSGTATQQFEVWWGTDDFYFSPGADCGAAANCAIVPMGDSSYPHNVADNSVNYTYIVVADNVCGPDIVSSPDSNVHAEFTFGIVPGSSP